MDERGPSRRLRFVRPDSLASPRPETAETILPDVPRVGALDALLREVDDLRLTLETDLTLVAAAVEAGGASTAAEIIDGDLSALHAFEQSALGHLAELSTAPAMGASRQRNWARVSAAPFVAAAAVVGMLLGVIPNVGGTDSGRSEVSSMAAQSSLNQLTTLAAQGRTSEVRVAAQTLYAQISELMEQSPNNAQTAQQALLLLSYARDAIVQSGDGVALRDVLLQSASLTAKIRNALPASLRTNIPKAPLLLPVAPSPTPKRESPKPRPTASPSPTTKPTTSPKPSPTASPTPTAKASATPTATPSATPSGSPTSSYPLMPPGPAFDPDHPL